MGHLVFIKLANWSETVVSICLGFIAYIVGGKIKLSNFTSSGRAVLLGASLESTFAIAFVAAVFYGMAMLFAVPPVLAIVLASIAATTAPAATIAVIEQYKAKGKLTDMTLGIVALDDAIGVLCFSILVSIFLPNNEASVFGFVQEILWALAFGAGFGVALQFFAKFSLSNDYLFPLLVGLVFIMEALAAQFHFSALLGCIVLGFVANNMYKREPHLSLELPIEHIEEFIFILFFTLAGMHFSPQYFEAALGYIFAYVLARAAGKYIGAYLGARLGQTDNKTAACLGLTLLPQAGVAIGLIFQVIYHPAVAPYKELLLNTVLGSTIIYEIIGPFASKWALGRVNEIPRQRQQA